MRNYKIKQDYRKRVNISHYQSIIVSLSFLVSLLAFSIIPKNAQAITSDVSYTFDVSHPYSNFTSLTYTDYNLRHNDIITWNYSGSFSFEGETGLNDETIKFISDDSGTEQEYEILDSYGKHDEVLFCEDDSAIDNIDLYNIFEVGFPVSDVVEIWVRTDDIVDGFNVYLMEGAGTVGIQIGIGASNIRYNDGAWHNLKTATNEVWYHFGIDFDCITDKYDFIINDVSFSGLNYKTGTDYFDRLRIYTSDGGTADCYFDAIGYNWYSNYTTDDNKLPKINITDNSILSPDRYEFHIKSNGGPIDENSNHDIWGWARSDASEVRYENRDDIPQLNYSNYRLRFLDDGTITKDPQINGEDINLTYGFRFEDVGDNDCYMHLYVNSIEGNEIIDIYYDAVLDNRLDVYYYDGAIYQSLLTLYQIDNPLNLYEFNLYVNDFDVDLIYYLNGVYNASYTFDLEVDEWGINEISWGVVDPDADADYLHPHLDYFGIYQYNISVDWDMGWRAYYITDDMYTDTYNQFRYVNSLNESLCIRAFQYNEIMYQTDAGISTDLIKPFSQETDYFTNLWDEDYHWYVAGAWCNIITNTTFSTDGFEFSFNGTKISDGVNEYNGHYNYYNTTAYDDYYYYVKNHNLILNYTFSGDSWEGVQVSYGIPTYSCKNASLEYLSYYDGEATPFLFLDYTDYGAPNGYYEFNSGIGGLSYILPQTQHVKTIGINFTDWRPDLEIGSEYYNNTLTEGFTYGYIRNIVLEYHRDLSFTITSITLISAFIPIIVLLVPTFTIRTSLLATKKYSKYANAIVLPLLLFMTLIIYMAQLIPTWVLAVLLLIFGYFLIISRRTGSGFDVRR